MVGAGRAAAGPSDLAVRAVDHLDELATLEHEEQVGVAIQQPRVQLLGQLYGLSHPTGQHQLLDACKGNARQLQTALQR